MQTPYRKPPHFASQKPDPLMTRAKFSELEDKLAHLKKIRPEAAAEVARLAELGDFSENAEYQLAKSRLRGINSRILSLDAQLIQAEIIQPNKTDTAQLGNTVTVENGGKQKIFHILGSTETNPTKGIISHHSPTGKALVNHRVGDEVTVKLESKEITYRIIKIS